MLSLKPLAIVAHSSTASDRSNSGSNSCISRVALSPSHLQREHTFDRHSDGASVGDIVGLLLGEFVGLIDGTRVGYGDMSGLSVGSSVGFTVGGMNSVGVSVGLKVSQCTVYTPQD